MNFAAQTALLFQKTQHNIPNFYVMDLCIFREGLMMIPSEPKHVAQGQ